MNTSIKQLISIGLISSCCAFTLAFSFSVAAAGSGINNMIDCSQYPKKDLDQHPSEGAKKDCSDWAKSRGYNDGVLTPMEGAADTYNFEKKPFTCPTINPGNVGFYCVGLDKKL